MANVLIFFLHLVVAFSMSGAIAIAYTRTHHKEPMLLLHAANSNRYDRCLLFSLLLPFLFLCYLFSLCYPIFIVFAIELYWKFDCSRVGFQTKIDQYNFALFLLCVHTKLAACILQFQIAHINGYYGHTLCLDLYALCAHK